MKTPTEAEIQQLAKEYCRSIGSSITVPAYSAYIAGSLQNSSIVVFKDGTYIHCLPNESWEYENDENWLITIPSSTQFHPTPTEAEINEAADEHVKSLDSYMSDYPTTDHIAHSTWVKAVQWLQNYQTQGREKPVEQIMSNIDKLIQSGVESAAIKYAKPTDQLPTDEDVETINDAFIAGANWQASQPNPAIAVIESAIDRISGYISENSVQDQDFNDGLKVALDELEKLKKPYLSR